MIGCTECFKEQRSLNDIYKQVKIDAQNFANKEKVKVAIIQEGQNFHYTVIANRIPAGTREIIAPLQ